MNNNTYRQVKTLLFIAILVMGGIFASKYLNAINNLTTVTNYIDEQRATDDLFHCRGQAIQIMEGDTLWWIAHENCEGNITNVINKLIKVYGDDLIVGKTIYLPVHSDCELRLTDGGQVMEECV
jgi:hypothetical protein